MNALLNGNLSGKLIKFFNCYIVKGDRLVNDNLWVRDGIILDGLTLLYTEKKVADITIDVGFNIIAPGLIDIQVNGAYGYDFSNPENDSEEICHRIASRLPETGVTAFCPTIITSSRKSYASIIPKFQRYQNKCGYAKMLGLHLEGPFISKNAAGMHPKDFILDFGTNAVETIHSVYGPDLTSVKLITVAPELLNSQDAISYLTSNKIVVSLGHTVTEYKPFEDAVSVGATFVTHLFNAMPKFHHRKAHLFGSISDCKTNLYTGVIADLVHVHPAALRLAEAISSGKVILVTDCNPAFGLCDGSYSFGSQNIEVSDNIAHVRGADCLAGGTTSLLKCVRNFWLEVTYRKYSPDPDVPENYCGLAQALAAATNRPSTLLGLCSSSETKDGNENSSNKPISSIGSLSPGAHADLIIISVPDPTNCTAEMNLKLLATWIDGKPVHCLPSEKDYLKIDFKDT